MTDYRRLISLSVEIEGLLRILENRGDATAAALLADKYAEFKGFMDELTAEPVEDFAGPEREPQADEVDAWAPAPEPEVVREAEPEDVGEVATEPLPEPASEPVAIQEPEAEAPSEPDPVPAPAPQVTYGKPDIRRHLTLNDKYCFVREVFGGDEADFQATLDVIGEMTSPVEAVDYITGDLMLDAEDEGVKKFVTFIEKCFE